MATVLKSFAISGIDGYVVNIEIDTIYGKPSVSIVGIGDTAIKEGVKPYIIFSDATLIELCNKLPKTDQELLEIRGMGEKKFNKYGKEILEKLKS